MPLNGCGPVSMSLLLRYSATLSLWVGGSLSLGGSQTETLSVFVSLSSRLRVFVARGVRVWANFMFVFMFLSHWMFVVVLVVVVGWFSCSHVSICLTDYSSV